MEQGKAKRSHPQHTRCKTRHHELMHATIAVGTSSSPLTGIRRAGVKRSRLRLGNLLHLSVKLRRRCLVETALLLQSTGTDGVKHAKDTHAIAIGSVLQSKRRRRKGGWVVSDMIDSRQCNGIYGEVHKIHLHEKLNDFHSPRACRRKPSRDSSHRG